MDNFTFDKRYILEDKIGGVDGVVYQAGDRLLNKKVARKQLVAIF